MRKQNVIFWCSLLFMFLIIGFGLCYSLVYAIERSAEMAQQANQAERMCLENGYPRLIVNGEYFCVRSVEGTDEVIPLSQLLGE